MKNLAIPFVFALIGVTLSAQTTLQYDLHAGETFMIKQDAVQVITQEVDGASHKLTNTINGIMEFKVTEDKTTHYEMEVTFKDLNLSIVSSIQGELMNINAKQVTENVQSKVFNSLLNVPIRVLLAKNGDVLEVHGGDSLVSKMAEASGLEDDFSKNLMKKSLEKEFGSEALSNSYKQMTYIYPGTVISVGDTWENEYTGKLSAKNIWKLENLTDENASIKGEATVVMNVNEPASTMNLSGTQQTSITTDAASGFIVNMIVEGSSQGTSTLAQLGDHQIPTTIKSTVTYELIN